MTIVFASNNEHKIREIKSILGNSFTLLSLSDIKINEDKGHNSKVFIDSFKKTKSWYEK